MSLNLIAYPTASAISRALDTAPGVQMVAKYIEVGSGKQAITLDEAGRATINTLKQPRGFLEILNAVKVNPYQWQMTVDLKLLPLGDWNFTEFRICDPQKNTIAIYGSATQSLIAITEALDNALLAANLKLDSFPADSIIVEHHNLPLNLIYDAEFAQVTATMSTITVQYLAQQLAIDELKADLSAKEIILQAGIVMNTQMINSKTNDLQTQINNETLARTNGEAELQLTDSGITATLSAVTNQYTQQVLNP